MTTHSKSRGSVRKVAGLTVGMLLAGALVVSPVLAAKFLTKAKADKRFLQNTTETTSSATVDAGGGGSITAICPPGLQAVGGGVDSPATFTGMGPMEAIFTLESKPIYAGGRSVAWNVEVANVSAAPLTITAHAVCSK